MMLETLMCKNSVFCPSRCQAHHEQTANPTLDRADYWTSFKQILYLSFAQASIEHAMREQPIQNWLEHIVEQVSSELYVWVLLNSPLSTPLVIFLSKCRLSQLSSISRVKSLPKFCSNDSQTNNMFGPFSNSQANQALQPNKVIYLVLKKKKQKNKKRIWNWLIRV